MGPHVMIRSSTTHATVPMATQESAVTRMWTGAALNHAWTRQHANRRITCTPVCVDRAGQARCAMWKWFPAVMQLYVKVGVFLCNDVGTTMCIQEQYSQVSFVQVWQRMTSATMGHVRTLATVTAATVRMVTLEAIARMKSMSVTLYHVRMVPHARIWLAHIPVTAPRVSKDRTVS
jgi:hypothetical protein